MDKKFCCVEFENLVNSHSDLFKWIDEYGWVIAWIELTNEKTHTQKHTFGLGVKHCLMCGKKLESVKNS